MNLIFALVPCFYPIFQSFKYLIINSFILRYCLWLVFGKTQKLFDHIEYTRNYSIVMLICVDRQKMKVHIGKGGEITVFTDPFLLWEVPWENRDGQRWPKGPVEVIFNAVVIHVDSRTRLHILYPGFTIFWLINLSYLTFVCQFLHM